MERPYVYILYYLMWSTKRQTKKHKKQTKPKRVFLLLYSFLTFICLVLLVYSLSHLFQKNGLVTPLPKLRPGTVVLGSSDASAIQSIEGILKKQKIPYQFVTPLVSTTAATIKDVYVITLPDNGEVIVKKQDLQKQINSLQFVLSRLTMEGKRFLRLDLRFERPVIVMR